jgi:hypothetical protein
VLFLALAAACSLFGSVAGFGSSPARLERKMDGKYCQPKDDTPETERRVVEAEGLLLAPGTLTSAQLDTAWAACLDVLPGTTNFEVYCDTKSTAEPSCSVYCNAGCECIINADNENQVNPEDTTGSVFGPEDVSLSDEYCCDKRPDATTDTTCVAGSQVKGEPQGVLRERWWCIGEDCLTVFDTQLGQRCYDARRVGDEYPNSMAVVEANEAVSILKANTTALPSYENVYQRLTCGPRALEFTYYLSTEDCLAAEEGTEWLAFSQKLAAESLSKDGVNSVVGACDANDPNLPGGVVLH